MAEQTKGLSRGAFVGIIVGASIGVLAIVVAGVLFATMLLAPPPTVAARPGQDTFEALRLTDGDVRHLGLSASEAGHTPSTLATAVTRVGSDWRDAKGAPAECMFTGGELGKAIYPAWGTETDSDPLWKQKVISASQSFSFEGDPLSFVTLTSRTFDSEQDAVSFLLQHNDYVPACPTYTTSNFGNEYTTTVTALLMNTLEVSNSGWIAETADWVAVGQPVETAADLQSWVLTMQQGNVVQRLTMLVPADQEADAGPFFTELASVVAHNLATTVEVAD
jgi:hypothetical protein